MPRHGTLATLALVVTLAACHSTSDCSDAEALGTQIGHLGLPADADRANVPATCSERYFTAWETANSAYCRPENGFETGYSDAVYYGVCRDDGFRVPYRLGRTLHVLEVEQAAIADQLEHGETAPGDAVELRRRQRELSRELNELRTLARIRGHLEPAAAPQDAQ